MNAETPPIVFVGCSSENLELAEAIQTNLEGVAIVELWTQGTFHASHDYLSDLLDESGSADFAVFVFSPDDLTESRNAVEGSPRDNIVFEAGIFIGSLGRDRVFLLTPQYSSLKKPSDLDGITTWAYTQPSARGGPRVAVAPATNRIKEAIKRLGRRESQSVSQLSITTIPSLCSKAYLNLRDATPDIKDACKLAEDLKILSITGVSSIGRDDSVISTAELETYTNLKKIRVLIMSTDSRWIQRGLAEKRGRDSTAQLVKEIRANQHIVEIGFEKILHHFPNELSGIRYFTGEPCWRMIMTDQTAFVSTYADDQRRTQSRDLPVYKFDNKPWSFYHAFKRRFNDIWANEAKEGQPPVGLTMSAGGIVYFRTGTEYLILLLRGVRGNWVLPKGHKDVDDPKSDKTALREVSEESGVLLDQLVAVDLMGSYADNSFQDEKKEVFIYLIECKGDTLPELKPDKDHAEARWFKVQEALKLIANPDQEAFLAKFAQSIRQH